MARRFPPEVFARAARTAMERCDALAACTDEPGRVTRTFLSPAMHDAHRLVRAWMEEAGLAVRIDAVGNIVGRKFSACGSPKAFACGSHLDTVPDAGRYDGILGVVCAIAVAELLREAELPFHVDAVGFSEEEGVRFRTPFIGSRAMAGTLDPSMLALVDRDGIAVRQAIRDFGLDPALIPQAAYARGELAGFFEIHIEQGPVLESRELPLCVVDLISGQTRLECVVDGKARHAGTTPMELRRDALTGAAEMILAAERLGRDAVTKVATVGALTVEPNASNVVPGRVTFTVDVRHMSNDRREKAADAWIAEAGEIAARRELGFRVASRRSAPSVAAAEEWKEPLAQSVARVLGSANVLHHFSGAGHDAMVMAEIAPMAMMFVRCHDGISHHPDESVREDDVALAIEAAHDFLCRAADRASAPT